MLGRRPTRLAADGGACKHFGPPRLKPGVDMAVFCQLDRPLPASPIVSSLSEHALSVLFVLQVRLVGGTAF